MTIKRRVLLAGVFVNALLLLTVAIAAIATSDPEADRAALVYLAGLATILVPLDIVLAWVLCDARTPAGDHRPRATV